MTNSADGLPDLVRDLAVAITSGECYPPFPEGLTLADGEAMQAGLIGLISAGLPAGLKAGVGEPAVQEIFGLSGPLLGFLYDGRRVDDGAQLPADPAVLVECELGLQIGADGEIRAVCAAVELVRPEFAAGDLSGPHLAACNVAADRFMTGPWQPWTGAAEGKITGTCGRPFPLLQGSYQIDFAGLGTLSFQVQ